MQQSTRYLSLLAALAGGALFLSGCTGGEDYQEISHEEALHAEEHGHEHEHTAPHGGHLIELGEHQYNAEVVLEADPKQLVVYLLDAHAENAVPIEASELSFALEGGETITLQPQPQEGDPEGRASRFVASGGHVDELGDAHDLHGSVSVSIEGREFSGELSHDHEHGHDHDHDHPHEGAGHADH